MKAVSISITLYTVDTDYDSVNDHNSIGMTVAAAANVRLFIATRRLYAAGGKWITSRGMTHKRASRIPLYICIHQTKPHAHVLLHAVRRERSPCVMHFVGGRCPVLAC
jgi:hypothetical protein